MFQKNNELVFAFEKEVRNPRVLILGGNSVYHNGIHYAEYPYVDTYDNQIIQCFLKLFKGECDKLVLSGSFTKGIKDGKGDWVQKSEAQGMLDRANELLLFYSKTLQTSFSLKSILEINTSIRSKIYLEEKALTSYENLFFSMEMTPNAAYYEMCSWGFKKPMFDVAARTLGLVENQTYFFYPIGENSLQESISRAINWVDKNFTQEFANKDFDPESEEEKTRVMTRDFFNKRFDKEERKEYLIARGKKIEIPEPKAFPANQNLHLVINL